MFGKKGRHPAPFKGLDSGLDLSKLSESLIKLIDVGRFDCNSSIQFRPCCPTGTGAAGGGGGSAFGGGL